MKTALLELFAMLLLVCGVGWIYLPAGVIVAALCVGFYAYSSAVSQQQKRADAAARKAAGA